MLNTPIQLEDGIPELSTMAEVQDMKIKGHRLPDFECNAKGRSPVWLGSSSTLHNIAVQIHDRSKLTH